MQTILRSSLVIVGLAFLTGCNNEPERFDLSGTVTYKGTPVPAGNIIFSPDDSKGNRGPSTSATILNGKYSTPSGQGVFGGPYVARIFGSDGIPAPIPGDPNKTLNPSGKQLFPDIQVPIDLPKKPGSQDFSLPLK